MKLLPKKARVTKALSAWWYEERGAISVCIQDFSTILACRITHSQLRKCIERTKKK